MKILLAVSLGGAMLAVGQACRNFDDPTTELAVSPPSLLFTAVAGSDDPPPKPLAIDAIGPASFSWMALGDTPWLVLAPDRAATPGTAWVRPAIVGLSAGDYTGTISVVTTSGPRREATVAVTLSVVSELTLDGRWAGGRDSVALAFTLTQADTVITGTGTLNPPLVSVTVSGVYRHPSITLRLAAPDSSVTTFTGSLVDNNTMEGVLEGATLTSYAVSVFRQ